MPQQSIRQAIIQQRKQLSNAAQQHAADVFAEQLESLPEYQTAQCIAAYLAINGEANPKTIIDMALKAGKQICLPVVTQQHMQFYGYQAGDKLIANRYGILEPSPTTARLYDAQDIDIVITPLVAFDQTLNRIGMGGGFYDRFFASHKQTPLRLGIAYTFQKIDNCYPNNWDIPLHKILVA